MRLIDISAITLLDSRRGFTRMIKNLLSYQSLGLFLLRWSIAELGVCVTILYLQFFLLFLEGFRKINVIFVDDLWLVCKGCGRCFADLTQMKWAWFSWLNGVIVSTLDNISAIDVGMMIRLSFLNSRNRWLFSYRFLKLLILSTECLAAFNLADYCF